MTNGFTLARALCQQLEEEKGIDKRTLTRELSRPYRPMTDILFGYDGKQGILSKFKRYIKGMAHITGGGQPDNIVRMIPDGCKAIVQKQALPIFLLMRLFQEYDLVEGKELYDVFNMGVGFTFTVANGKEVEIVEHINRNYRSRIQGVDRRAAHIGKIVEQNKFEFENIY